MKKKVLATVTVLVLLLTSSVFASISHEGTLEFTWDKDSKLNHTHWGKLTYDFYTKFNDTASAGFTVYMDTDEEDGTEGAFKLNWDGWATMDLHHAFVTVKSWEEFTGASYLLADGDKLPGGPGIRVESRQLGDLNLQGYVGNYWEDGMIYGYGAKADYSFNDIIVKSGFHATKQDDLAASVFLGAEGEVYENVYAKVEAGFRNNFEDWRTDEWGNWYLEEKLSGVAVSAEADYTADGSEASLLAVYKTPFYIINPWDDDVANNARDLYFMSEWTGLLLGLDYSHDVTPYLTMDARIDSLLGVKDSRDDSNTAKVHDITPFGFGIGASYRAGLGTTVRGSYDQYDQWKKVSAGVDHWEWSVDASYDLLAKDAEGSVSYTFADGYVAKVFANKSSGQELGYGAKLTIEF